MASTSADENECIYEKVLRSFADDSNLLGEQKLPCDFHAYALLLAGDPADKEPLKGILPEVAPTTARTMTTDVTTLVARPEIRHCVLPKTDFKLPSVSVRFDSKVKESLQPILVQCVSQVRILLEKCQNFLTLKSWIKFPLFQFPQWEDHFSITWGDEGEMAIYIHHVGPTPYALGDCVAVLTLA